MTNRARTNFTSEYAQLVVDKNYSIWEVAEAMNVGKSSLDKWARQLKHERNGIKGKAISMTPEQFDVRELKKRIARIEEEKEILKN